MYSWANAVLARRRVERKVRRMVVTGVFRRTSSRRRGRDRPVARGAERRGKALVRRTDGGRKRMGRDGRAGASPVAQGIVYAARRISNRARCARRLARTATRIPRAAAPELIPLAARVVAIVLQPARPPQRFAQHEFDLTVQAAHLVLRPLAHRVVHAGAQAQEE